MGDVGRQFAARVREIRQARGWSQEKLADALRIHQTNYAKLERGQRKITLDEAAEIARMLGQPIDLLIADPRATEAERQLREALFVASAEYDGYRQEHARLLEQAAVTAVRIKTVAGHEAKARRRLEVLQARVARLTRKQGESSGQHQAQG